jgi:hypothetical protein
MTRKRLLAVGVILLSVYLLVIGISALAGHACVPEWYIGTLDSLVGILVLFGW